MSYILKQNNIIWIWTVSAFTVLMVFSSFPLCISSVLTTLILPHLLFILIATTPFNFLLLQISSHPKSKILTNFRRRWITCTYVLSLSPYMSYKSSLWLLNFSNYELLWESLHPHKTINSTYYLLLEGSLGESKSLYYWTTWFMLFCMVEKKYDA